jgi:hypothetical protein
MEDAMATQSLSIKKVIISKTDFDALKNEIISLKYDVNLSEGFYVIQEDDKFLNAYYIYDVINSINIYDVNTNQFAKTQQKQQEYVSFFLDYDGQTLDIFGNKTKCAKVINALGKISKYKITIDDVMFEHTGVLKALEADNISYQVNRIKIKDYQFFDDLIGDCTLNVENYNNVEAIFNKYKDNITQFSITIDFEQPTVFMFYKSGAISIYKNVKDIEFENIKLLKKCMT